MLVLCLVILLNISINTTEVDPPSDSLHNGIVKILVVTHQIPIAGHTAFTLVYTHDSVALFVIVLH